MAKNRTMEQKNLKLRRIMMAEKKERGIISAVCEYGERRSKGIIVNYASRGRNYYAEYTMYIASL